MGRIRRRTLKGFAYVAGVALQVAAAAALTLMSAVKSTSGTTFPAIFAFLQDPYDWIKGSDWWLALLFAGIGVVGKVSRDWGGSPRVWRIIQAMLNEMQKRAFKDSDEALHFHRVTLFQHRKSRFMLRWSKGRGPRAGWLFPVARSGFTSQTSDSVFLAPDDADNAEGVAGHAWRGNGTIVNEVGVPDLGTDSSDAAIKDYADATWVSEDWVRKRLEDKKNCPRSFCGVPIEVKGKRYGVLLLDSRKPENILDPNSPLYRITALMLGELLAEA